MAWQVKVRFVWTTQTIPLAVLLAETLGVAPGNGKTSVAFDDGEAESLPSWTSNALRTSIWLR